MDGELAGTPFRPLRLHRIYRLIVVREDQRVRVFTRNGHDWSGRFPWIFESALKNRQKHFVLDGEAVVLASTAFRISTLCTRASTMRRCSFTPRGREVSLNA
jgi:hypothetical protein